jgi:hypothetical protein
MKTCTKCCRELSEDHFYATSKGGIASSCKDCTRKRVSANYRRNREHYREYERGRASLPHRIEAREQYKRTPKGMSRLRDGGRRYIERNPVKRAAHILVGNAIRAGKLTRQPCEVCGCENAQAHHDDYGKPLDVRWLCTTHHAEWHKHNTPACPDQSQEIAA